MRLDLLFQSLSNSYVSSYGIFPFANSSIYAATLVAFLRGATNFHITGLIFRFAGCYKGVTKNRLLWLPNIHFS